MTNRSTRRFSSVGQAISYYRFQNPARQKFINLTEPDHHQRNVAEQFSGDHPADIWASVRYAVRDVVEADPEPLAMSIFALKFLGERDQQYYKTDIAKLLNLNERYVAKVIGRLWDALDDELVRRELKEPDSEGID